jgi:hypothetical protein
MATQSITCAPTCQSDAYFRDWGKKLSDAMTAVGFIKADDTGQIDWTTVSRPASANTMAGYEIRRFSDALQSSNPVFVKIEYGCGSSTSYPYMKVVTCRETDGAGNIVGEMAAVQNLYVSNSSVTSYTGYISGASDRIQFCLFANSAYSMFLSIERLKDSSGNPTADGVNILHFRSSGTPGNWQQYFPKKGLGFPLVAAGGICCAFPYVLTTANYNGNIGLFPIQPVVGYSENPDLSGLIYFTGDIATGTEIDMTLLGSSHHYLALGSLIGTINANTNNKSIAMRYE